MGRPSKEMEGPQPLERMKAAFWELYEEVGLPSITASAIAARAGVNRNTFYYHYDSVEDMAAALLGESVPESFIHRFAEQMLLGQSAGVQQQELAEADASFRRLRTVLQSCTPELRGKLKEYMMGRWLELLGVRPEELPPPQRVKLEFIWGGVTAVVENSGECSFAEYIETIAGGITSCLAQLFEEVKQGQPPDSR